MKKLITMSGVVFALMALGTAVHAAKPGAYIGGGIGYSKLENFNDATAGSGGVGGKAFVGYNFNKFFGLEAGYMQFANTKYTYKPMPVVNFTTKLGAATLLGKAYLPFQNNTVNLFASLGVAEYFSDVSVGSAYSSVKVSRTQFGQSLVAGLGASYQVSTQVNTSLEYTYMQGHSASGSNYGIPNSNLVTLNLAYGFN